MKKVLTRKYLLQKIHIYYFAVVFFSGLIFGIILSIYTPESIFKSKNWIFVSLALLIIGLVKFRRIFLILIFIAGITLGLWRASYYELSRQDYSQYFGKIVTLKGEVSDDIYYGSSGDMRLKIKNVFINNKSFEGEIWLSSHENQNIKRSDILTIEGRLNKGFGGFFASLSGTDILSISKNSSQDFGLLARDKFAEATEENIKEPERALGLGFLLGQKNDLPEDLQNKIKLLGLSHIVVASGYNLTILIAFARRILAKVSKYLSALFGAGLISGFILITGFSPSMSRAGLVAGLSLTAWYYGRKIHPVVLLLVSAGITLAIKPSYIWGDLGWYLSFLAFIGVLILAPLIHDFFWGNHKKPAWFRELLIVTFSAQIMTLPILLYSFGIFSVYSLLANLLILPIIPFAMLSVFISGVFGLVAPFTAGLFSLPANWILNYCTFVIDKVSAFPGVASELSINFKWLIAFYIFIFITILMLKLKTKHNFLKDKMIVD